VGPGSRQVIHATDHFGTISRVQLPHHVSDMDFDRALANTQFMRDDLVRFTLPQTLEDRQFPFSELVDHDRRGICARPIELFQRQAARRHVGSPGVNEPNDFNHLHRRRAVSWDETARTAIERLDHEIMTVQTRQYDYRCDFHQNRKLHKLFVVDGLIFLPDRCGIG